MSELHYYESDELKLAYRDYGEGSPIICLPGLTRNSRDFTAIGRHLSERYRVVAPDLRGRGHSEWDKQWRNYHPATYAVDIERLWRQLDLGPAVIIGTSLGGLLAMILASRGAPIRGVVLNDVGPEVAPEGLARILVYVGNQPPVANWDEAKRQAQETYGPGLPDLSDQDWDRFTRQGYREDPDGTPRLDMDPAIGQALREVGGTLEDPWVLFGHLGPVPTLVIRGESSDILSPSTVATMQARKPDLEVVTIPNRGHVPLLDETESVAAIDRFLNSLAP